MAYERAAAAKWSAPLAQRRHLELVADLNSAEELLAFERQREQGINSLYRLIIAIVLAIVTMTFAALIAAFVFRSGMRQGWTAIRIPPALWGSTVLLAASSVTFHRARMLLRRDDQASFYYWAGWSFLLGLLFLGGQIMAWIELARSGVFLGSGPHSSFIFIFSGVHGLHIVAGLIGFAYLLVRTRETTTGPRYNMKTRAVANALMIFWDYLDLLWLVLFALLLGWRR